MGLISSPMNWTIEIMNKTSGSWWVLRNYHWFIMIASIVATVLDVVISLEHLSNFTRTLAVFFRWLLIWKILIRREEAKEFTFTWKTEHIQCHAPGLYIMLYCDSLALCHDIIWIEIDVLDILKNKTLRHLLIRWC